MVESKAGICRFQFSPVRSANADVGERERLADGEGGKTAHSIFASFSIH